MSKRISAEPELTVSMPAYNTAKYIGEAIDSVLSQKDIEIELIVIDDFSDDNTAEVLKSYQDRRLRVIYNKERKGIGYCHNLAIKNSRAPFITHVDSDDKLAEGALKKVLDAIREDGQLGKVHTHFYLIDEKGFASRADFRKRKALYLKPENININYKKRLLSDSWIVNHLRTYRKDIFDAVGGFNEELGFGIDYDMAIRIADKYEIKLIPEGLYYYRKHNTNTTNLPNMIKLRMYCQKKYIIWNLIYANKINYVSKVDILQLVLYDLFSFLKKNSISITLKFIKDIFKKVKGLIMTKLSGVRSLYGIAIDKFSWWPISLMPFKIGSNNHNSHSIAYYIWKYPVLSQTFIQREIKALKDNDFDIKVFRDHTDDTPYEKYIHKDLNKDVYSLYPIDKKLLLRYATNFLLRSPINYINLFLYVVFHKYTKDKQLGQDISLFEKATYLAGKLTENKITHVHAPWANVQSFIALIASKIAGITYSVQARAYDIHRSTQKFGMEEKFSNAKFVITNTDYNYEYLSSEIENNKIELYKIYNGVDLDNFCPKSKKSKGNEVAEIITVGRIVEQKGFEYLLKACAILKQRGLRFNCNLIGGTSKFDNFNYYLKLKELHKTLELESSFNFVGAIPLSEVMEYYENADIFVLPCVIAEDGSRDIIPNVVLEAMAMKIPVVSTTITGLPEMVDEGKTGILVPRVMRMLLQMLWKSLLMTEN